ncbi:E3 ubiquitin-protein ligase TRIM11-like [Trachinotus anak]|uniref:E3 ubiquitin-protein ligase TRIM11-like n=1 Tax=Trachinotus anak TaxID=443729 RepID=UPI0039F25BC2
MRSDWSKDRPPNFSPEPGPSDSQGRKRSGVSVEEQLSCCALCQDVLKDPVSTSCGHWFCRQCFTSYWNQSGSSGDSSCPQCGQRPRTRPGVQTASQTSTVQACHHSPLTASLRKGWRFTGNTGSLHLLYYC